MKKKKILVTVGSTKFDELVEVMDNIAKGLNIEVVFQIGQGKYLPKRGKWFRYDPNIKNWYKWADVVVCIDSAGTIFENLELGNKVIAVRHFHTIGANDLGVKLSKEGYIIFINTNNKKILSRKIGSLIKNPPKLKKYQKPKCEIDKRIIKFIGD